MTVPHYLFFKDRLGKDFLYPSDAPDLLSKYRHVEMYTSCTETGVKKQIIASFTSTSSPLRVLIATVAFGMGVDCSDIRKIIHFGPPSNVETYLQATGRAGRDGEQAYSLLLNRKTRCQIEQPMADYAENTTVCHRELLFKDFYNYTTPVYLNKSMCCDLCAGDYS